MEDSMSLDSGRYRWATLGDLNAFFGLMLDNVTNLVFLAGILILTFGFPADIVYTKMFPGTALGVLVGDAIYTWMAFRLAKRTGNRNVTAMPLGLDAPSTIGIAFAVLGPTYLASHDPIVTWHVGMATLFMIGVIKLVLSFVGPYIQKMVPEAGLLGSLAGIGVALLGLLPLIETFGSPIAGLVALGLILYALVARIKLPFGIPSVFLSVVAGAAVYYIVAALGFGHLPETNVKLAVSFPIPTLAFVDGIQGALKYLPVAIPFGLLTVIGGINVTESARVAGDNYNTRSILLTEAFATLVAAVCGGVSQSTPYIGHPAYKRMGGRAAYTLATGLFIGLGGIFGYISFIAMILPLAALAPILIFVGLDIVEQAYHASPKRHASAVTMAILPTIADLVLIKSSGILADFRMTIETLKAKAPEAAASLIPHLDTLKAPFQESWVTINALAHGFILTGMLWGAATAKIIDRNFRAACAYLVISAGMSFFGVIHSVSEDGGLYLPWNVAFHPGEPHPYTITAAYLVFAAMLAALSRTQGAKEEFREEDSHG
ncbi:MAG: hypothetical protein HY042_01820 [Spirochaetia bacterium]|nr:hypothetical protein [Spirochaetia bacterium]